MLSYNEKYTMWSPLFLLTEKCRDPASTVLMDMSPASPCIEKFPAVGIFFSCGLQYLFHKPTGHRATVFGLGIEGRI